MPDVEFIGGPRDGGRFPVILCREYIRVVTKRECSAFIPPEGHPELGAKYFPHLYCLCQNSGTGDYAYIYEPGMPEREDWMQ